MLRGLVSGPSRRPTDDGNPARSDQADVEHSRAGRRGSVPGSFLRFGEYLFTCPFPHCEYIADRKRKKEKKSLRCFR